MLDVEVTKDVVFREFGPVKLRLDVYRPRHATGPVPAAIYIHGGAWVTGNRRHSRFMLYELAAAGWAVFSISYRFAPRFPLPAAIEDCKAAVAWVREHGAQYGARTEQVVVIGGSAGGHLASLVALTPNDPRFQPGFEGADTRVQGAVVLYGVPDFEAAFFDESLVGFALFQEKVLFKTRYKDNPEVFRMAQPVSYLSKDAPPMLLVHGESDSLVPIEASRQFYRKLREAGAGRVHLLEVPLGLHAFEITPGPLHQRSVRVILRFLASLRRPADLQQV
jgi:acetyl esterase/lipase